MARIVKGRLPAATGRPESWGDWEWRDHLMTPAWADRIAKSGTPAPNGIRRACLNKIYVVMFFTKESPWGMIDHLMIRRQDAGTDVPWADKQRIKSELIGEDRTALEVFPARDDLVDQANIYHLWVLPKDMKLPFGL